jgi:hypothetical protein
MMVMVEFNPLISHCIHTNFTLINLFGLYQYSTLMLEIEIGVSRRSPKLSKTFQIIYGDHVMNIQYPCDLPCYVGPADLEELFENSVMGCWELSLNLSLFALLITNRKEQREDYE